MKNKKSQTNPRKVGFLVPIAIYVLCVIVGYIGTAIVAHIRSIFSVSEMAVAAPFLNSFSLILSYISSYLYAKKKKWGYCGFAFLIISVALSSYIQTNDLIVALLSILLVLSHLMIGILLYMSYDWFRKVRRQKELEKQNLQSELKLLKNQLNPHFLFNTLNNIDSLIHSDPTRASESLVQMSGMMRYMIYETKYSKSEFS